MTAHISKKFTKKVEEKKDRMRRVNTVKFNENQMELKFPFPFEIKLKIQK